MCNKCACKISVTPVGAAVPEQVPTLADQAQQLWPVHWRNDTEDTDTALKFIVTHVRGMKVRVWLCRVEGNTCYEGHISGFVGKRHSSLRGLLLDLRHEVEALSQLELPAVAPIIPPAQIARDDLWAKVLNALPEGKWSGTKVNSFTLVRVLRAEHPSGASVRLEIRLSEVRADNIAALSLYIHVSADTARWQSVSLAVNATQELVAYSVEQLLRSIVGLPKF